MPAPQPTTPTPAELIAQIEARRADPEFQARLRMIRERDAETLRILADH